METAKVVETDEEEDKPDEEEDKPDKEKDTPDEEDETDEDDEVDKYANLKCQFCKTELWIEHIVIAKRFNTLAIICTYCDDRCIKCGRNKHNYCSDMDCECGTLGAICLNCESCLCSSCDS